MKRPALASPGCGQRGWRRRWPGGGGRISALLAGVLLLLAAPGAGAQQPVVDQSFTTPGGLGGAINECCKYIGQTFTAGRTGRLAGVNVEIVDARPDIANPPLAVAIYVVQGTVPTGTALTETIIEGQENVPLTQLITFPEEIQIEAGSQYAIVVGFETALVGGLAHWEGGTGDPYPEGSSVHQESDGRWFDDVSAGFDLHFRTYVHTSPLLPTSKTQCKNGGWRNYGIFKNQGDCVSFVATGGRSRGP